MHCARFVVGGAVELKWSPIAILRHLCAQAVWLASWSYETIGVRSTGGLREPVTPQQCRLFPQYSITAVIGINWVGEPSEYAENPDNWSFL